MSTEIKDVFEFERLLRNIAEDLHEDQMKKLEQWKEIYQLYQTSWESFELSQSVDDANSVQRKIGQVLDNENTINTMLSSLFQQTPDPSEAQGLWDAGKERERRENREKNIISLKKEISSSYVEIKRNGKLITDFKLLNQPTVTDNDHVSTAETVVDKLVDKTATTTIAPINNQPIRSDVNIEQVLLNENEKATSSPKTLMPPKLENTRIQTKEIRTEEPETILASPILKKPDIHQTDTLRTGLASEISEEEDDEYWLLKALFDEDD